MIRTWLGLALGLLVFIAACAPTATPQAVPVEAERTIPPIDTQQDTEFETATFGMG